MDILFGYGVAFIFGLIIGWVVYYFLSLGGDSAKTKAELDQLKQEHTAYRSKVDGHFLHTAELFKDLTDQYREVYKHMASGADTLCSEEVKKLQADLGTSNLLGYGPNQAVDSTAKRVQTDIPEPTTEPKSDEPEPQPPKEYVEVDKPKAEVKKASVDEDADGVPFASEVEVPSELRSAQEKVAEKA